MMQGMSFPPHPAGMQPGVPHGHPGMPPNAQHMGQPMQMPGVSGPGAPHMGQPAMMGMQPGQQNMPPGMGPGPGGGMMPQQSMGGPGANAMAMSHLNPQTHMMQQHHQMQQAMASNPQLMMQQQHLARQRQMMAAQQAQQQQQQQQQQQMNGMGMGMGMNGHPGMSPQQFAQMQGNPAFQNAQMANLPPQHIMQIQQMRQIQAAQAQQHAQQQQQQQQTPHPQGPQAPATPQMQQQSMAQHMAMQHASSQASHQSAPQNSQAPPQQPPPAQMRSQSQIPSGPEGQGQASQHAQPPQPQQPQQSQGQAQQQQQPQQQQPPQQQQQQPPPQPPSAQPTPQMQAQPLPPQPPSSQPQQSNQQTPSQPGSGQSQNQPQNAQQQQQQQQQAQQQAQQAQQQQQMQNAQQQQQRQQMMNMNNMNMMRQQQAMAAQQQQQQQQQQPSRTSNGQFILKLIQFSDHLSAFNATSRESNSSEHWANFVNQFWTPDGRLVQHVLDNTNSSTKQFMISASSLARYYWTWFDSGVQNIQLQLEGVREIPAPNNAHWVTCTRARYVFWFANNTQLIWQGKLTASFPAGLDKFESLEFEVSKTEEFIPRSELARVVAQGSPLMNKSPKLSRTPAKKAMQKAQGALQLEDFPSAPVNEYAVTPAVMQYLEVAETIFFMKDLMEYSQKNELRPHDAMNQMVAQIEEQQQFGQPQNMVLNPMQPNHAQMALQRNGIVQPLPQGAGTPSQAHMQLPGQTPNFSSPSVPHMNLPMQHLNGQQMMAMNGSPHIAHPGLPGGSLMAPNHMMGQMHHSPSPNMGPPMMVPQHSQQGNNPNSAHPSASTSPNLSSKRRRSQVKLEGDDMGLEGPPSQRMKPSPGLKKK